MITYIAPLRGINVGGKSAIKMADLRDTFSAAGAQDVRTYINTGIILRRSDLNEPALLAVLAPAIRARFGWDIPLVLRIRGRKGYLIIHMSVRLSKLAQKLDRLSPIVTIRNWKTVCKLAELAGDMN